MGEKISGRKRGFQPLGGGWQEREQGNMSLEAVVRLGLKRCSFFAELPDAELARLAQAAFVRVLRRGETLFRERQPSRAVFCLDMGRIQLVRTTPAGGEVVIRSVGPGELFAEATLFERQEYPVTARAAAPSRVIGLARNDFLELLRWPSFRDAFLGLLMRRLRYLTERVEQMSSADAPTRLAKFLAEHGGRTEGVTVPVTKKEAAAAMGMAPETLSRLLRRLRRRRWLTWRGHTVSVAPAFWETYLPRT